MREAPVKMWKIGKKIGEKSNPSKFNFFLPNKKPNFQNMHYVFAASFHDLFT